ncbi:MAG TPA: type 4a pilus biogenesis protein PilO [Gaiellaceae bacterium]
MKKNVNIQKHAFVIAVAVCGVFVLGLGWFVLLGPKQKEIGDLHKQTVAVQQQIADDLSRAAAARSATSAPTIKTADIYKLETAMPSIVDMPDLLLELDQTAQAAGVTLTTINPDPLTDSGNGYAMEHISMSVNGNFYTLTDLLYRLRNFVYVRGGALEANGRAFNIDKVTLTPNGATQDQAQIDLDTYVYGTSAVSASSSSSTTAPPPTGTTTTTTTTATTPTTTTPSTASGPSATGATP